MYDNVMNKFKYGGLKENPDIYLDETVIRMCYTHRRLFNQLAQELLKEGEKEKALKVLQRAEEEIPASVVPHEAFYGHSIELADAWATLGHKAEAEKLLNDVSRQAGEYLEWYLSLGSGQLQNSSRECMMQLYVLNDVSRIWEKIDGTKAEAIHKALNDYAMRCQEKGMTF